MTDANAGSGQLDTAFPPPPEYYKQFTAENLAKLAEHRTVHPDTDRDDVPGELSFLVPPTIPPEDDYYIFGRRWLVQDILPTLPEQNVEQLYPEANFNRVKELKKLNTSLIFKYLELIERLSQKPEKCETDIDDIRLILINMHHLINEYRPYQARETLKLVMADQVERRDRSAQEITNGCEKLRTDLAESSDHIRQKLQVARHTLESQVVIQPTIMDQPSNSPLPKGTRDDSMVQNMKAALDLLSAL